MKTEKKSEKKDRILDRATTILFMILLLNLLRSANALEWEYIYGGESPGIKIIGERPLCWFSPTEYWIEEPYTFNASNIRFDSLDGVIEYFAKGTGAEDFYYSTHVYETTYNHFSQPTSFKEDRYYPSSGKAYHLVISDVSYDASGKVEDGYTVRVTPTVLPPMNPPEKATNPDPGNGSIDQQVTTVLNWSDGGNADSRATSYDVYLSTNRELLTQPWLDDSEFKGTQIETTFDPVTLLYGTTYYWRIDAKNGEGIKTGEIWSFTTKAIATVIYVDPDATGANNGSSWEDAYNHLQDALAHANAPVKPLEIRVAEGTYRPDQGDRVNIGDRDATFQLTNGASLKGGYAGFGEYDPDMRNRVIFETILSGDLLDNDGPNPASYDDNSSYVVTGSAVDETAILDGFTITAGAAGGIYNHSGSPTVANCSISGNDGYGMMNEANSNPNLTDCTFSWNSSTDQGGGMSNAASSNPVLTNCIFSQNEGSGVYNSGSDPILTNCKFDKNKGSGVKNHNGSNPTLTDCTFSGNITSDKGGGFVNGNDCSPTLIYNTFNGNAANQGGGIYNEGNLTAINCRFSNNTADYYGGGMYNYDNSRAVLANCTFGKNTAKQGSGIYNKESDPNLVDCIFSENTANNIGGAMYNEKSSPILMNCMFSKNRGSTCGGMYNYVDSYPTLIGCTFIENKYGGMYNYKSSPKLTECEFLRNSDARAITNANESGPVITDCTFVGNSSGGVYNASTSSPSLTGCTFSGNFAEIGGGLYNSGNCTATIDKCTFTDNTANRGGAAYNEDNSSSIFTECIFNGNSATSGAGFYFDGHSSAFPFDSPILSQCTFADNVADNYGGGMYISDSSPALTSCAFLGNIAKCGSGIYNAPSTNPTLVNCKFTGNLAYQYGGGLYNSSHSEPLLSNCLLNGNSANRGGGVYNYYSSSLPSFTNCTFSGNFASEENSVIHNRVEAVPTLVNCIVWHNTSAATALSSGCVITYSNIQNGWPGEGNIDIDPLFVEPGHWADVNDPNIIVEPSNPNAIWIDGNYHLKSETGRWDPNSQSWIKDDATSPCVDAGDPNSDWTLEIWPHGKWMNMGTFGGTVQASMSLSEVGDLRDLNNDDLINWDDVILLAEKWDSHDGPLSEDLDRNGVIDSNDVLFFIGNWMDDSVNTIPVFDLVPDQHVTANRRLILSISATDADGDPLEYLALGLPDNALFFEQVFSWTAGLEQKGDHLITFIVTDQKSLSFMNMRIIVDEG